MIKEKLGSGEFISIVSATGKAIDEEFHDVRSVDDSAWMRAIPVPSDHPLSPDEKSRLRTLFSDAGFASAFSDLSRYLFVYDNTYKSAMSGKLPTFILTPVTGDPGAVKATPVQALVEKYSADSDANIPNFAEYIRQFVFSNAYFSSGMSELNDASDANKTAWTSKVSSAVKSIISRSSRYDDFNECLAKIGGASQTMSGLYTEWKSDADHNFAWISIGQDVAVGIKNDRRAVAGSVGNSAGRIIGNVIGTETKSADATQSKKILDSDLISTINHRTPGSVRVTAQQTITLMVADAYKFTTKVLLPSLDDDAFRGTVRTHFMDCLYYVLSGSRYIEEPSAPGKIAHTREGEVNDILESIGHLSSADAVERRAAFVQRVIGLENMDSSADKSLLSGLLKDSPQASGPEFNDVGNAVIGALTNFFKIGGERVTIGDLTISNTSADINEADTLNKAESTRERVESGYINAEAAQRLNTTDSGYGRGGDIQIDDGHLMLTVQDITTYIDTAGKDPIDIADELREFKFPHVIGTIYRSGCQVYSIGYGLCVFENVTSSGYSEGDLSTFSGTHDKKEAALEIASVFLDDNVPLAVKNKSEYDRYVSAKKRIIQKTFSDPGDFLDFTVGLSVARKYVYGNINSGSAPLGKLKESIARNSGNENFKLSVNSLNFALIMMSSPDEKTAADSAKKLFHAYLERSLQNAGVDDGILETVTNDLDNADASIEAIARNVYTKCSRYISSDEIRNAVYLAAPEYSKNASGRSDIMSAISCAVFAMRNYVPANYVYKDEFGSGSSDDESDAGRDFDIAAEATYKYLSEDKRDKSDAESRDEVSIDTLSTDDDVRPESGYFTHGGLGINSDSPYYGVMGKIGKAGAYLERKVTPNTYHTIRAMITSADSDMNKISESNPVDPAIKYVSGVYGKFKSRLMRLINDADYKGASELCKKFSAGDMFVNEDIVIHSMSVIQKYCMSGHPEEKVKQIAHLIDVISKSDNESKYSDFVSEAGKKLKSGDYSGLAGLCDSASEGKIGAAPKWTPLDPMYPDDAKFGKITGASKPGKDTFGTPLENYLVTVYFPANFDESASNRSNNLHDLLRGCVANDPKCKNFVEIKGKLAYEKNSMDNSDHLSGRLPAPTAYTIGKFMDHAADYVKNNYVPMVPGEDDTGKFYYIDNSHGSITKGGLFDAVQEIFGDVISGDLASADAKIASDVMSRTDEYPMFTGMNAREVLSKILKDVTGVTFTGDVNEFISRLFDVGSDAGKMNAAMSQVVWGDAVKSALAGKDSDSESGSDADDSPAPIASYIKSGMIDPDRYADMLKKNVSDAREVIVDEYDEYGIVLPDNALDNRKTVLAEFKRVERIGKESPDKAAACKKINQDLAALFSIMGGVISYNRGSGRTRDLNLESSPEQSRKKFNTNRRGLNAMLRGELDTVPDMNAPGVMDTVEQVTDSIMENSVRLPDDYIRIGNRMFADTEKAADGIRTEFGNLVQRKVQNALDKFITAFAGTILPDADIPENYTLPVIDPDTDADDIENTDSAMLNYRYCGATYNKLDLISRMFSDYCGSGIGATKSSRGQSIQQCVAMASKVLADIEAEELGALGNGAEIDTDRAAENKAAAFGDKVNLPASLYSAVGSYAVAEASTDIILNSFSSSGKASKNPDKKPDAASAEPLSAIGSAVEKVMSGNVVRDCSDHLLRLSAERKAPVTDITESDDARIRSEMMRYLPPSDKATPVPAQSVQTGVAYLKNTVGKTVFSDYSDDVVYAVSLEVWKVLMSYLRNMLPKKELDGLATGVPAEYANS